MFIPELKKKPDNFSNYSEYFETAEKIINICKKEDFEKINEDIWSLFKQTLYNIYSRPIKENRYKETEDKILSGFLLLASSFLEVDSNLKERLNEIKFEN